MSRHMYDQFFMIGGTFTMIIKKYEWTSMDCIHCGICQLPGLSLRHSLPSILLYHTISITQADDLSTRTKNHPWAGVDLVLLHTNATPRQLVGVSDAVKVEVWDRVRLLLALFTSHAASIEARTQVRIARLQSDRTVLRELANQSTTGERAGYGGGGITALQASIANINREFP